MLYIYIYYKKGTQTSEPKVSRELASYSLIFHAVYKSYYGVDLPYRTALNEDQAPAPISFKVKNESKMYESSRVEYSSRD